MQGLRARKSAPIVGEAVAPGDKSISHRSLILGAMAEGETGIEGLLEGDDILRTAAAMRALGAGVERERGDAGARWTVRGAPWRSPAQALYFGNAGTGVRLVLGAAAGAGVAAVFDGDGSLRARPMGRIATPLEAMGATISLTSDKLPASLEKSALKAVDYTTPVASAQIKSAILLAALGAEGTTCVRESVATRDHTERMLKAFGVDLEINASGDGGRAVSVRGGQTLKACSIAVPGDPSSAAFIVSAALIVPGSDVLVKNVLLNPLRVGYYETLMEMGAAVSFENLRERNGEEVGDVRARHSSLKGVAVPAARAASMIDEYPILSVVAAFAKGETRMEGVGELRVKESDRIASVEAGLKACGVATKSGQDWLTVKGKGAVKGGAAVAANHDHRIAMSFLIAGLASAEPVAIDDAAMIATSFPDFTHTMIRLGADIA